MKCGDGHPAGNWRTGGALRWTNFLQTSGLTCAVGELAPTKRILTLLTRPGPYHRGLPKGSQRLRALVFVIDMKDAWRKLVKRVFPEVKVIDPFHVIQDATTGGVDQARLIEQDGSGYSISKYGRPGEKLTPKQVKELESGFGGGSPPFTRSTCSRKTGEISCGSRTRTRPGRNCRDGLSTRESAANARKGKSG